ncbi:ribokinase [Planctomycetales bacterium]|nr:ribokinase [Planctomycetales bacterium]
MKTPKVTVVGSAGVDMVIKAKRFPAPGETITGGTFMQGAGGKGANQAVAAARLGAEVTFVARVGADVFGKQLIDTYQQEGIKTDHIIQDATESTAIALILVDEHGENLISVASGANMHLSGDDVLQAEAILAESDIIVSQLETPLETLLSVGELARKHGVPLILDPAPAPDKPLPQELLAHLSYIKPNETEASRLTGIDVVDAASAEKAARILLEQGAKNVIVTLGTKGSLLLTRNGSAELVPAISVQAMDTTGAGDAYSGAFAVAIAQGRTFIEAARFATLAASISVTRLGTQPSLPYLHELQ